MRTHKYNLGLLGNRSDVTRLLEFSLQYKCDIAIKRFPMFSAQQIRSVYSLAKGTRKTLLADRTADREKTRTGRTSAQSVKLREIGTDPSNR